MTNWKQGRSSWGVGFQTDAMYNFEIMSSSRILNGRNPDFYIPNQVFWMRWLSGACRRALVHRAGLMGGIVAHRGDRQPLPAVQQDPPWNFQHKMGGHMPGINHHSVPGTGLPKIWPWVLSFCRGHFCILEGLILYIFFQRLIPKMFLFEHLGVSWDM